jgi:hypothetical protein
MQLLGIAHCLRHRFDWHWGLGTILAAMPLTYLVAYGASLSDVASWLQSNLAGWVTPTQVISQIALIVAALVAIMALRTQRTTWAASTLLAFQNDWTSERMRAARRSAAKSLARMRRTGTWERNAEFLHVLSFFEQVGFFCRRHGVPAKDAWVLFSSFAEIYWIAFGPVIAQSRHKDTTFHEEFDYLIQRFRQIEEARGLEEATDAEVPGFLESEELL